MDDQTRPQPQPDQPTPEPQWTPPPTPPQPPQAQWAPPPPQGQQPQPQWSPPPQQPAQGWGAPGYAPPPPRPMAVTVTGIFFVIWGVLVSLFGVLFLIGGQVLSGTDTEFPGFGNIGGAVTLIGAFVLVLGILWLASGIGVFMSKQWARIIGIIMGVIGVIIFGIATVSGFTSRTEADGGSIVISLIVAALSALAVWALATAGPYFAFRR